MMEIREISSTIFQRPQPGHGLPNSACFTALDTPLKPRAKRVRYPSPPMRSEVEAAQCPL